jgi:hypothetical protein
MSHQLLGHTLLVDSRLNRLLPCCFGCHVVDRVSHGLTPLGFRTSQFHRSADSPADRTSNESAADHGDFMERPA